MNKKLYCSFRCNIYYFRWMDSKSILMLSFNHDKRTFVGFVEYESVFLLIYADECITLKFLTLYCKTFCNIPDHLTVFHSFHFYWQNKGIRPLPVPTYIAESLRHIIETGEFEDKDFLCMLYQCGIMAQILSLWVFEILYNFLIKYHQTL